MGACIAYNIAHRPPFFLSASHQTTATSRVSSGSSTRKKARHQPTDARVDVSSHINNAPGLITPLSLSMHRNSCSNTLWTSRPDCADQCTRARTSTAHGPPLSPSHHTHTAASVPMGAHWRRMRCVLSALGGCVQRRDGSTCVPGGPTAAAQT